ncbi:RDD family protein [Burkholderia gladioli]|uniref:RDD family protein n=1 Tax=Burkholderia gladioli TaxID=28095 RepID=UPI0016402B9A|nr:RDD family protein [Burkholderia gladioli]
MIFKHEIPGRASNIIRRLLATLVDVLLIMLAIGLVTMFAAWLTVKIKGVPADLAMSLMFRNVSPDTRMFAYYQYTAAAIAPYAMATLPLIWWLYDLLLSWRSVSTPGKWLLCLQTASTRNRPVRLGEAALRCAVKMATMGSVLFIGKPVLLGLVGFGLLLIPALNDRGQFLHDLIPGTIVTTRETWIKWFRRTKTAQSGKAVTTEEVA